MLAKILLLPFLVAEDAEAPAAEAPPLFGPYTEETAERYDHDAMSMVWISFKSDVYAGIYYDGDSKKDMQETDALSVSSVFGPRMTKLAGEIESGVSKKYHIVFFDSKEYKDIQLRDLTVKWIPRLVSVYYSQWVLKVKKRKKRSCTPDLFQTEKISVNPMNLK